MNTERAVRLAVTGRLRRSIIRRFCIHELVAHYRNSFVIKTKHAEKRPIVPCNAINPERSRKRNKETTQSDPSRSATSSP